MASVIIYKRQSHVDIIPENEFYFENQEKGSLMPPEDQSPMSLFHLPYFIQVQIASYLSQRDTFCLANTCMDGWRLSKDQQMWKDKLWLRARVVSVSLDPPSKKPPRQTTMVIRDPLLIDNRKLYMTLDLDFVNTGNNVVPDLGNFLRKISPSANTNFQDLIGKFRNNVLGIREAPITAEVFKIGYGAPSFLLFGPPESYASRRLALSFLTSRCSSVFETVGLVMGKPGGVGGGVTVQYEKLLMNILPIRKIRPRLLINGPNGILFQQDVTDLIPQVDGLICYIDGSCKCSSTKPYSDVVVNNNIQKYQKHYVGGHYLDLLELETMLQAIPSNLSPPILVLLAHSSADCNSDSDSNENGGASAGIPHKRHYPSLFKSFFSAYDIPWAVCDVEVEDLAGIRKAINWFLKRTLMLR